MITIIVIELFVPVKVAVLWRTYSLLVRICEFGKLLPLRSVLHLFFLKKKTTLSISGCCSILSFIVWVDNIALFPWSLLLVDILRELELTKTLLMLILWIYLFLPVTPLFIPLPLLHLLDSQFGVVWQTLAFTELLVLAVNLCEEFLNQKLRFFIEFQVLRTNT